MRVLKPAYSIVRSIIMSLIVLVIVVYVGLYVLLSVPSVQQRVKTLVCREVSGVLGGALEIGKFDFLPFSEVRLSDVSLDSPSGERCASISQVAAGIDLWTLVSQRKIVLTYAEIIGLDAEVSQTVEDGPLNIQFLIDALSPKDRTKPAAKFDLRFRNIVIRRSKATFMRPWLVDADSVPLPLAAISLSGLRMDLSIPVLKNDDFRFDIRGMQFNVDPGVSVRDLSALVRFRKSNPESSQPDTLFVKNLNLKLPASSLSLESIVVPMSGSPDIDASVNGYVTPADFASLVPRLSTFDTSWNLDMDARYYGDSIDLNRLDLQNPELHSDISVMARAAGLHSKDSLSVDLADLRMGLGRKLLSDVAGSLPSLGSKERAVIKSLGDVSLNFSGTLSGCDVAEIKGGISSDAGSLSVDGSVSGLKSRRPRVHGLVVGEDVKFGSLLASGALGDASFSIEGDVAGFDKSAEGVVRLYADYMDIGKRRVSGVDINLEKQDDAVSVSLSHSDSDFCVEANAGCLLKGALSEFDANVNFKGFSPASFGIPGKLADSVMSGSVGVSGTGDSLDNMTGSVLLSGFKMARSDSKILNLDNLSLKVTDISDGPGGNYPKPRRLTLRSDWVDADVSGTLGSAVLMPQLKGMLAEVFPALLPLSVNDTEKYNNEVFNEFNFQINIKGVPAPYDFFNLPVRPLSDIPVSGFVNTKVGKASLEFATPHIQQGSSKLIRDTRLRVSLDSYEGVLKMSAGTLFPAKKGDVQLALDINGMNDRMNAVLKLNPSFESNLKGELAMDVSFSTEPDFFNPEGGLSAHVDILPSVVSVSNTVWTVANGKIDYAGRRVAVKNFLVHHAGQYVKIDGVASESPDDVVKVRLNDIDLDYIFGILNINYVTFGGMATGELTGSRLLTKSPVAYTNYLRVKDLSYNGAVLGDGDLSSDYDASAQKVGIYAVIRDPLTRERRARIDGGIWVTRDSLSFGFDADKVNLRFMKPFVSAFCSDLRGRGSGKCRLFGTFKDIDLIGNLKADTLSMKLDFTNTWYHAGNDSVFMHKGVIEIPPLALYDTEGHTAELSGWLRHTYFHDPVFNFRVRNARSLLCYDTNEKLNPLWYGTIYGSGSAQISGRPGIVDIEMNMSTDENSKFYYVISDTEEVDGISFLSFTDRKKEKRLAEAVDTVPPYLRRFMKRQSEIEEGSGNVILSLKGSVTPDVLVTLVMDPKGGDKITARGQGALQMDYNMAANDLRMFGTYVLDEGNYNFTLQDIIIKNFSIRKGSMIKFDGDPMNANLDIAATYRVNTNLTDLDKSFSTDKELNRTNVPVDALLLVNGPMTHPDISFDIELPSLTSDVERKVKSIVSTNDMMSRQIIYLLALNRFYTPEYTGASSAGGAEWSSMASSTISSQLSNILSQMTDKLSVAPSFRSDKGDFTDMEFDLALSSRLLNNRLLINGNFGYRDRSTSNTQFVGDFDIEYILSKNGNLRLKAYNHFNDQNYYLRSALTTQGVGVVFRHDFDHLWRRASRKDRKKNFSGSEQNDSLPDSNDKKVEKIDSVIN